MSSVNSKLPALAKARVNADHLILVAEFTRDETPVCSIFTLLSLHVDQDEVAIDLVDTFHLAESGSLPEQGVTALLREANEWAAGDGAEQAFPMTFDAAFDNPLASGQQLRVLDVHVFRDISLDLKFYPGLFEKRRHLQRSMASRTATIDISKDATKRMISDLAAEVLDKSMSEFPNVKNAWIHKVILMPSVGAIKTSIRARGSKRKSGCKGRARATIDFLIEFTGGGPLLEFTATQKGAPHSIVVSGTGAACKVGDWITGWRKKVKRQIRNIRVPQLKIVSKLFQEGDYLEWNVRDDGVSLAFNKRN